jgi:hypothetical protein
MSSATNSMGGVSVLKASSSLRAPLVSARPVRLGRLDQSEILGEPFADPVFALGGDHLRDLTQHFLLPRHRILA